jgi:hypothetical protein
LGDVKETAQQFIYGLDGITIEIRSPLFSRAIFGRDLTMTRVLVDLDEASLRDAVAFLRSSQSTASNGLAGGNRDDGITLRLS